MNRISVLIPCYNAAKWLPKLFSSLLKQKDKNFNLVIINDGSIDNTYDLIKEFSVKNKNILNIKIYSQNNIGLIKTRVRLVELCETEYFIFVDSDDWVSKNFISSFAKILAKKESSCIVGKNKLFVPKCYWIRAFAVDNFSNKDSIEKFIFKNDYGYLWNKLFKKEKYVSAMLFLQKLGYWPTLTEDHFFISYFLSINKDIQYNMKHTYFYRKAVNSLSIKPSCEKIYEITLNIDKCCYERENILCLNYLITIMSYLLISKKGDDDKRLMSYETLFLWLRKYDYILKKVNLWRNIIVWQGKNVYKKLLKKYGKK